MKYKHYAPAATLTLLCGSREDYAARVNEYYETLQRAGEEDGFYAMCLSLIHIYYLVSGSARIGLSPV